MMMTQGNLVRHEKEEQAKGIYGSFRMFWDLSYLDKSKVLPSTAKSDLFTGTMPSQKNLTGSYRNGLKPWKRKIKTDERQLVPSFKGKHPTCAQFEKNWDIRWKAILPNLCPVWMQSRLGALCMWWSFLQLCLWHTVCLKCAILKIIQSFCRDKP